MAKLRYKSSLHEKWHRRVEGQLRHVMFEHEDWFSQKPLKNKNQVVRSIAKRIVGEIVAGVVQVPDNTDGRG